MMQRRRITFALAALLAALILVVPVSTVVAAKTYTITASAGTGGTIAPSGSVKVSSGDSQTFTITPDTGYRIVEVLVDGGSVGAVTSYTFINVVADHSIAASFVAPWIYFATPSALPGVEFGFNLHDFAPYATGVVWFDADGDGARDAEESQLTVTVNAAGSYGGGPLASPADALPGPYTVYADVPEGGAVEASAIFTVRGIILSPASGTSGTIIDVTGLGFATNRTGTVWFDSDGDSAIDAGEPQVAASTDSGGTLSPVSLTVPAIAAGSYYVRADMPAGGFVPDVSAGFTVLSAPTAAFTSDVQSGAPPLTVQFTDQSSGSLSSWAWDFDNDGAVDSTEQNPVHIYDAAGIYTVKLAVANAYGSDDEIKTDYISVWSTFTVTATAGDNGSIDPVGDVVVVEGGSQSFTFTAAIGYHVADVLVDGASVGAVTSYDFTNVTANHTISVSFATDVPEWDLNGDGVCNIGDVVVIGLHWGESGTPGWIPQDLNSDGVINIGDVVVLGLHWGETW
jgi:PKD repeat protein